MSVTAIAAKFAKKKAKSSSKGARRPSSKCSSLVRKRDSLDQRIKAIEKANAEGLKREQDKIEARHQAQHKKIDDQKARELQKLATKYGQACVAKPRKPRSDKGRSKGAEPTGNSSEAPKATKRPRAKKAAKRQAKAEAPASEGPGSFGGALVRRQLLTTDAGVSVLIKEDETKLDGPLYTTSKAKDTLTRGSFSLSGEEFGGSSMVYHYAIRTVQSESEVKGRLPLGYSSSAQLKQEKDVIAQYPVPSFEGLDPQAALAKIRPLLFDAAAKHYRKLLRLARQKQARREASAQQQLPCPGGC